MDSHQRVIWFSVGLPCLILLYLFFLVSIASINRTRGRKLREIAKASGKSPLHARLILLKAEQFLHSLHAGLLLVAMLTGYVVIRLAGSEGVWGWIVSSFTNIAAHVVVLTMLKALFFFSISAIALVFVQLTKAVAYAAPETVLLIIARPILLSHRLLSPIVTPVRVVSRMVLSLFNIGLPLEFERPMSAEELTEMVELSTKAGEIEEDEQEMIESVFLFSDTVVEEVMTPRGDIAAVSIDATFDEVIEICKTEGFSRLVVTGKDLDDVKGVLLAKDLFAWLTRDRNTFSVQRVLRRAFFVQHSRKIDELLKDLRREKVHLAIVLDEHGGVDGIVTVEDLVEELVGEIADEFDHGEVTHDVPVDRDDMLVDGSLSIDDFNSRYNLSLPTGEYDTIAGFMLSVMGRIPKLHESVCHSGLLLTAEEIEQNRVTQIRVQRGLEEAKSDFTDEGVHASSSTELADKTDIISEDGEYRETPRMRISGSK